MLMSWGMKTMFNIFKPLILIILHNQVMSLPILYTDVSKKTAGKEFGVVCNYLTLTVQKQQLAGCAEEYPHALAVPSARK
jgi:hypothetical protein